MSLTAKSTLCMSGLLSLVTLISPCAAEQNETGEVVRQSGDKLLVAVMGSGEPQSIGSYSLRIYQQDRDRYITGLVAARDGDLADAWLTDLDEDDNPEVLVWLRSTGSGSYGTLDVYQLDGASLQRVIISEPPAEAMRGYRGHDKFVMNGNNVQRKFPRYAEQDTNAEPSGETITLQLDFDARRWLAH
jgi:hypothetical protein